MRRITISILFLYIFLTVFSANSRMRHIGMENGLTSNTVRNIMQDKYGYMWFGSDNGLCRYDGINVMVFRIPENGYNQYISAMLANDEGIYVGTEFGVFLFHLDTFSFERLPMDIHSVVSHLSVDKDSVLWVATSGHGIWRYAPANKEFKHYDLPETYNNVSQVFIDNANQVWAVSNSDSSPVNRLNRLHDKFEHVQFDYPNGYGALRMLQTRDGRLWLGSWDEGLLSMQNDGKLVQVFSPRETKMGLHIHTLFEHPDDIIYMGCDDGVVCYNLHTRQCHRLSKHPSPNDRFIYAIDNDTEGGLWIGTFYGGVYYIPPGGSRFESYTIDNGLSGNVISRFCEDREGHVWVASDDGGLICYNPQEQRFLDFPHQEVLRTANVHALAVKNNELWIGTYTQGVYVLDLNSSKLRNYTAYQRPNNLSESSSYAICHDSKGRTWVATMSGLDSYDSTTDGFHHALDIDALTIDIDEDSQQRLWLATQGGGLWCYSPATGKSTVYKHLSEDPNSLPDNQVNCCMVDEGGRLWAGTMGGLCYFDEKSKQFVKIDIPSPFSNITSIIEDQGVLWLATESGIVKYQPSTSTPLIQCFTRHDGLVSEQFLPNAALKTDNGRIYFGAVNGFNTFFPYQIKANNAKPPVYVTGLEIIKNQQKKDVGLPLSIVQHHDVAFDYNEAKILTFSFVALSYSSPEKNRYAYRLEGFEKEWNYVENRHHATYTNLPAGNYVFHVKATNNDGIWSDHEATVKIEVLPPFWWSWYARVFYALLAVAVIWFYIHSLLRRTEQRHQQELQQLQEQQEKQQREARLNFFTMIAHEIRTPVSLIIAPLEKIKNKTNELTIIDRNAHRLLELVNQLLDFQKVEQQNLIMHFAPCNVRELLQAICERFAPTVEQGGRKFSVEYPDRHFTAIIDREGITKVVSNLLTNANKYTKSQISLRCVVEPDEKHFRIIVTDDGVGIRKEDYDRIFEPFFQSQDNKPGTGIGLNIVKNIVNQHHGSISVSSEIGRGSTFTVILPVDELSSLVTWQESAEHVKQEELQPVVVPVKSVITSDHSQTLLIVDDSPDMVTFLENNFSHNYHVLTAHDGIEALHLLSQQQVDLIVSDWMMPRMDGAEFCHQMRSNPLTSHIPFIMLTAKTDDSSKVKGMDFGADAYIEKPFSVQVLEATIRNILSLRRQLMEKFSSEPFLPVTEIASNQTDNEFLERMTKIIEKNIDNADLSVNFLAEELSISRSGLFAKIKSLADVTPNEMIQIIRLKRAAQLLREGKYLVSEVGYKVGFSNPSYFSKCFQKQFGIKPGDFMKK